MSKKLGVLACFLVLALATATPGTELDQDAVSTYIVHMSPAHAARSGSHRPPSRLARGRDHYASLLRDLLPARISHPGPRVLYSYAHAATGFAARMTARQAAHLGAQQPHVVAVVRDTFHQVHTTLSSSFLHLAPSTGIQAASNGATDAVIGVLDMGVYPKDRASFAADPSLSPSPPPTFRGGCVSTPEFNATAYCNNKLVGAKMFYDGYERGIGHPIDETEESKSPLDTDGHGTHTASTAAGAPVPGANLFGFASGTARGTAPGARIAVYKVCWKQGCASSDILAGMDEAIADGVDVISLSLGSTEQSLVADPVAIGGFSAVRRGIVVSTAAGNTGPKASTVANAAPWVITVGASSMNRQFPAVVVLGDGQSFVGTSLYPGDANGEMKSLVYGGDAGSAVCEVGKLDASKVSGKIVLCDAGTVNDALKAVAVEQAGGLGAIISSTKARGEFAKTTAHLAPATAVTYADAVEISRYMSATPYPVAKILFFGTLINGATPPAPRVASFSGHGPSAAAPGIVKPDVVAPGVDILAAWTGANSPTKTSADTRRVEFNVESGTSMSCPHVSGIAALLKMARPSWTPAMIKSALMTTAYTVDSAGDAIKDMATGKAAGPFELGAGHVDPNRAVDPGLVYDAGEEDYRSFLCALGYPRAIIDGIFTKDGTVTDCSAVPSGGAGDLNLPSFSVVFTAYGDEATLRRVVRNVGDEVDAVYTVAVVPPSGTQVTVTPSKLEFDAEHPTLEYTLTVVSASTGNFTEYTHGSVLWSDGKHEVRSPIAVTWPSKKAAVSAM